jgi:plastocyanin
MRKSLLGWTAALAIAAGTSFAGSASAANFLVNTEGSNFEPADLSISVGDTVTFTTTEFYGQSIYSLSPAKSFSLSIRGAGDSDTLRFNEPGIVKVRKAGTPESAALTIRVEPRG